MMLRAGIGGLVLLLALDARADEPGAPLENSKQELKSLQKAGPAQTGETSAGKLRDAMPQLQTPGSSLPAEPRTLQNAESQQKKQQEAQKNWLLDGVNQLEKNSKPKNRSVRAGLVEQQQGRSTQNDSNTLLDLYDEQQQAADAKAEAPRSARSRNDPFSPFLQEWLADSPVRGRYFDEYLKKPEADGATITMPLPGGSETTFTSFDAGVRQGQDGVTSMKMNPYLQAMDMAPLHDANVHNLQPNTPTGSNPPPVSLADPGPAPSRPERKQPLPALSDDNKYFPQLKKF